MYVNINYATKMSIKLVEFLAQIHVVLDALSFVIKAGRLNRLSKGELLPQVENWPQNTF